MSPAPILLEDEQWELLARLVAAARTLSRDEREPFFVARTLSGDSIIHRGLSDGEIDWYFGDVEILAREGLLNLRYGDTPSFDVTPRGFQASESRSAIAREQTAPTAHTYSLAVPRAAAILAKRLFAGDSGMNMREVVEYFCGFSDDIPDYPWQPALGYRAEYFDACLRMLSPEQQRQALQGLVSHQGPLSYGSPSSEDRERLAELLRSTSAPVDLSQIENLDWPIVMQEWRRAANRIPLEPDGAITSARTLLETVCKHICRDRGVEFRDDGDLGQLYRAATSALNLAPEAAEPGVRQILSGCISISNGLASTRNALGDSHGRDQEHTPAETRHARLAVNVAGSLSIFLIETHEATPTR